GTAGPFADESSIFFRNSTSSRNRAFTVGGIESRGTYEYASTGRLKGELLAGTRLHSEHTSEQRLDGQFRSSTTGDLREDERRSGLALSGYVQNRLTFFEQLQVSPGMRVESFWYEREILRQRTVDSPTDLAPPIREDSHVLAVIP